MHEDIAMARVQGSVPHSMDPSRLMSIRRILDTMRFDEVTYILLVYVEIYIYLEKFHLFILLIMFVGRLAALEGSGLPGPYYCPLQVPWDHPVYDYPRGIPPGPCL